MNQFTRRQFVAALAAAGVASPALASGRGGWPGRGRPQFLHGVASGDPLHDRVILWTRVTPPRPTDILVGRWTIAKDPAMRRTVGRGWFATDIRRDFTVKVDARNLEPGCSYYYRFECDGARSCVGRTRTLPRDGVKALRLAFVSCSNYPYGYFNAYRRIAERADLDFVLHLGDYLYEYELGNYVNPLLVGVRDVQPTTELLTLTDYRLRHAQYKTDPDLQEAHRQHPFICVWDDHEIANDAYKDGAENHDPATEGQWTARKRQAVRAYNEWIPIRDVTVLDDRIFRSFRVGDLADLIMLDTRLYGRDPQAAFKGGVPELPVNEPPIADPHRSLLGFDQEAWLYQRLSASKTRGAIWRILGQQVMMAQLSTNGGANTINPDQWDGYGPSRQRLYDHLTGNGIDNVVVTTGDIHSSWCNDLSSNPWDIPTSYNPSTGQGIVGVEFVSPAVSSPPPPPLPGTTPAQTAGLIQSISPHIKYVDLEKRGYVLLDIDRERVQGEVYHVGTVDALDSSEGLAAAFVNFAGDNGLQPASGASPARPAPDPAPPCRD
jgi:alkaline phosphatase D